MKIQVLSDLHIESGSYENIECGADVAVLAGDIGVSADGVKWAKGAFDVPVIYVAGNHEYYLFGHSMSTHMQKMKDMAQDSNVIVLDNETVEIGDVRFIGTTLWTDLTNMLGVLYSDWSNIAFDSHVNFDKHFAQVLFDKNVAWLKKELEKPFNGRTVVVTHHAPSDRSISPEYEGNPWNNCFVTDMEGLMGPKVDFWIHGHVHSSHNYIVKGTRVICNPRGYSAPLGGRENNLFEPDFTFDSSS